MTYFYKKGMYIARKDGGDPPSDTYIVINPQNEIEFVKNGQVIEGWYESRGPEWTKEEAKQYSDIERKNLNRLYTEDKAMSIAKSALLHPTVWRKRENTKPKPARKIKVVKKCICK